jgi:hypothetical protein
MPKKESPYSDAHREQHPMTIVPNDPAPTVAQALKNSQAQIDKAK